MDNREASIKTEKAKLEAYGMVRPVLEKYKDDSIALYMFVEIAWEMLAAKKRYLDIAMLAQNAMSYIALGMKRLEEEPVGEREHVDSRIIITWNGERTSGECGVCGRPGLEVEVGPALYVESTDNPVCHICAEKHAPGMTALFDLFTKNKQFRVALETMRQDKRRKSGFDF